MPEIILPEESQEEKTPKLAYKATEEDEERFFLMYHLQFQPSETEGLSADYRKWIIARFMAQKHAEQEMMERQRLMQQIGPNFKAG